MTLRGRKTLGIWDHSETFFADGGTGRNFISDFGPIHQHGESNQEWGSQISVHSGKILGEAGMRSRPYTFSKCIDWVIGEKVGSTDYEILHGNSRITDLDFAGNLCRKVGCPFACPGDIDFGV